MLNTLSSLIAKFEAVPVDLAQLRLPTGFHAIYVLFADGFCYFGRTKGPKRRWKEYRGVGSCGRKVRLWLQSLKERGIEVQMRFLAYCPEQVVADVEDAFILWGRETFGERCLNVMDGTRPWSEVALGALSKTLRDSPRCKQSRRRLADSRRGKPSGYVPTEETRRKLSKINRGRKFSQEWRRKIVAARTTLLPEQDIIAAYLAGESTTQLASRFSVTHHTIANRLRKNGVTLRYKGESNLGRSYKKK